MEAYDLLKRKVSEYRTLTERVVYLQNVLDKIIDYQRQNLDRLHPYQLEEIEKRKKELRRKIDIYRFSKQKVGEEIRELQSELRPETKSKFLLLPFLIGLVLFSMTSSQTGFLISGKLLNPLAFLIAVIILYLILR